MEQGIGKRVLTLALLAWASAAASATAATQPGVTTAVWTVGGGGAAASSPVNVLTLNDQRRIDNRITAYTDPGGRLVLTAPEGLGDPDGSGAYCSLDNGKPGESSATQVSCAPGYIGLIAGDLGGGSDTFNADPGLTVMVGGVIDGQYRPLSGGPGRDRLVGGSAGDLMDGGPGPDTLIGGGGNDTLIGSGGPDKISGGGGTDLCRGGGGVDSGKSCEARRSIP